MCNCSETPSELYIGKDSTSHSEPYTHTWLEKYLPRQGLPLARSSRNYRFLSTNQVPHKVKIHAWPTSVHMQYHIKYSLREAIGKHEQQPMGKKIKTKIKTTNHTFLDSVKKLLVDK